MVDKEPDYLINLSPLNCLTSLSHACTTWHKEPHCSCHWQKSVYGRWMMVQKRRSPSWPSCCLPHAFCPKPSSTDLIQVLLTTPGSCPITPWQEQARLLPLSTREVEPQESQEVDHGHKGMYEIGGVFWGGDWQWRMTLYSHCNPTVCSAVMRRLMKVNEERGKGFLPGITLWNPLQLFTTSLTLLGLLQKPPFISLELSSNPYPHLPEPHWSFLPLIITSVSIKLSQFFCHVHKI